MNEPLTRLEPDTHSMGGGDGQPADIQAVRSRLADIALCWSAVFVLPVLLFSLLRSVEYGWHLDYFVHILICVLLVAVAACRRRLPYRLRASVFLGAGFVTGATGLVSFGLTGNGILALAMFVVLSAAFFGARAGLFVMGVSLCMIAAVGVAACTGGMTFSVDIARYATSTTAWAIVFVSSAVLMTLTIVVFGSIHTHLQDSLSTLRERTAELEAMNKRLCTEIDGRKKAEEHCRTIVEDQTELICRNLPDGTITFVNQAYCRCFGRTADELIGQKFIPLIPEEDRPQVERYFASLSPEDPVATHEHRVIMPDGKIRWQQWTNRAILNDADKIIEFQGAGRDVTDHKQAEERIKWLNRLCEDMLGSGSLAEKMKRITDGVIDILGADFARIWFTKQGDMCDSGCMHAKVSEGPHVCRDRSQCLHLVASSGRYTHIDGETHRRVPFGCYEIGRVAGAEESGFLTNDVAHDPRVHNHGWARELGLVSFAGYRLASHEGSSIGVLALFSKQALSPSEEALLQTIASTASKVILVSKSEEALRESEERFRNLFDNMSSGCGIFESANGNDFTLVDYNRSGEEMDGIEKEGMIGRSVVDLLPDPESELNVSKLLQRVWKTGKPERLPTSSYQISGRMVWRDNYIYKLPTGEIVGIFDDVTERKRAEEALLSEKLLSEEYINSLPGLFYVFDEKRFVRWNKEWERTTGYSAEELGTKYGTDFFEGEDRTLIGERMLKVFREGASEVEAELVTKDGRRIPYYFTGLRREFDGKPYLIGLGIDITERKRAEEALQKSEERFRRFAMASGYGFAMGEFTGQLTFANAATLRIVEEESEERFINKTFYQYYIPEDAERLKQEILPIVLEKGQWVGEVPLLSARGNLIATEQNIFLVRDEHGAPRMVGNIITDITERKRAEEEKLALERQVQHAQKLESLGVLAGGIAHDFNNLLMGILGNADLALNDLAPMSPARRNLQEIEKASRRAAELAQQMLAYSGKGRFVVEPINGNELVEELAHLLEVSISKKTVLKYNFAENLPAFDGDATQIRQVVMNLITNASEAIGEKSGVVALSTGAMHCDRAYLDDVNEVLRASLDKPLPEGIYTYVEVADTGCGMDAETMEKIFDPFFTTKFTGRGLGMSAVLGIVRGHKGALKVYSEVGRGTTFKVLFPANALPDNSIASHGKDEAQGNEWRGSGTVLIADDEEIVCAVAKQMLVRLGFTVLTASDGRAALKVFGEHADEIVCVLLDLTMPHLDGEEAFREMRRLHPGVRVILCSGYNEQDATQRFAGKGLAGFIQKPFNMAALREKLMEVLPETEV